MDPKDKSLFVRARGVAKASLTRIDNYVNSFRPSGSINAITFRLEDLPRIRQKFEDAQDQLELNDSESHEDARAEFETLYYDLWDRMSILTDKFNAQVDQCSVSSGRVKRELKLPTINLPSFGGNILEFRHFYDIFSSLVVNNDSLDDIQRYHYLLSSLTGEAHDIIKNLPITASNFAIAWETVCQRYNNTRLIITAHVKRLLMLPTVNKESPHELRALLNEVSSNLNAIKALNPEVPLHELILTQLILNKIDESSRRQWELQSAPQECTHLSEICKFLEERCQALDHIKSTQDKKPTIPPQSLQQSNALNRQPRQTYVLTNNRSCVYCKGMHPLFKCNEFANSSFEQRLTFVKEKRLCGNCLRSGHNIQNCTSGSCYTCGMKHHTLLHQYNRQEPIHGQTGQRTS